MLAERGSSGLFPLGEKDSVRGTPASNQLDFFIKLTERWPAVGTPTIGPYSYTAFAEAI
jgi:hypothetical protein